jgi:hypothetical protein
MRLMAGLAAALCLLLQPASAQPSPALDPYLIVMQQTLRFDPDDVRVAAEARRGDAVISMGVAHLRTGVLQNELRRGRALASVLPSGVPGFYAGQFATEGGEPGDMWCFARNAQNIDAGTRCIVQTSQGWMEAGDPTNPYFAVTAQVYTGAPVPDPVIEERPIDVHSDLRAEYIFRGWGDEHIDVQLRLAGRPMLAVGVFKRIQTESDGSALLQTPFGLLRL